MNLSLKQKDPDANNKEIDYSKIEPEEEERLFHTSICNFLLWPAPSSILTMLGVKYLSSKLHSFHSLEKQAVLFRFSYDKPLHLCKTLSRNVDPRCLIFEESMLFFIESKFLLQYKQECFK